MCLKQSTIGLMGLLLLLTACAGGGEAGVTSPDSPTAGPATASIAESLNPLVPPPERLPADKYAQYEMVTLLPRDAIPAIDNPQFLSAAEANDFYDPDELVIGVVFNEDARAYSVPFLSSHEIVNDTVGSVKIAVTW